MPDRLQALTRLTFDELGGAAGGLGDIHRAIADRAFGAAGSGPPRGIHDAIAGGVYAGLRGAAGLTGRVAGAALAGGRPPPSGAARGALGVAGVQRPRRG